MGLGGKYYCNLGNVFIKPKASVVWPCLTMLSAHVLEQPGYLRNGRKLIKNKISSLYPSIPSV